MCAFSLLNFQTPVCPQWWLNSNCSKSIMTSVILPLVLPGLFALLIKEADWWLGTKPGCVGILYARDIVQFEMCMCVFRQAWRTAEVELQPEPCWCFHTCHRISDPHQHNNFRVNSRGVFQREEKVARRMIQLGCGSTTCCKSYSSMLLGAICFQSSHSDRIFASCQESTEGLLCLFFHTVPPLLILMCFCNP